MPGPAVIAILLLSGLGVPPNFSPTTAPGVPLSSHRVAAAQWNPSNTKPGPNGLPGADPSGEPFINAPQLALAHLPSSARSLPVPAPTIHMDRPSPPITRTVAIPQSAAPGDGNVTGTVRDAQKGGPIVNASIVLTLVVGGCPNSTCPSALSGVGGSFAIAAPPGTYTVEISANLYAANATAVTVRTGVMASLGTIYLVEDAFAIGRIVGYDPTHEPVANATVLGASRNQAISATPNSSAANGTFRVEIPPGADRIDFAAPGQAPYEANHTFVEGMPGRTVDVGTLFLVRGTLVKLELRDRVTHQPIGPNFLWRSFACSLRTGDCPLPNNGSVGPNATVYAVPGPTLLHLIVLGYVVNVTSIGVIPAVPAASSVARTVNLTPLGVLQLTPGATGGVPTKGGTTIGYDQWWVGIAPYQSNISGLDVCSLEGVEVGILTAIGLTPDVCFPETISVLGGSTFALGPPLRDWVGSGAFEGAAPMFQNETWVNLTPDRLTSLGFLNFTPGAYISGQVYITGTGKPPAAFSVRACSTDESAICGPTTLFPWNASALVNGTRTHDIDAANASLVGCPIGPADFCIAAPPGPVEIVAQAGSYLTTNMTWAEVPFACCSASPHALPLASVTTDRVRSLNLTPTSGTIFGHYRAGPGAFAPPLDTVEITVCPVTAAGGACTQGYGSAGNFTLSAPLGWDEVNLLANGYQENETWIDVNGTDFAGTIVMTPEATVSGTVVDPNGTGVLGAVLEYCPLASVAPTAPGCQLLSTATTGTSGYYAGRLPSGIFPGASYDLSASASGFLTNRTWLNATPGALVTLPPIVLTPVGNATPRAPFAARPAGQGGTPGTWVDGRLVDGGTGAGLAGATLTACTFSGATCVTFPDLTGTGGQFNQSLPLGSYYLTVSVPGYSPGNFFVNATSTASVHLGAERLAPFPWVSGRVAIAPWVGYSIRTGLGPGQAVAQACNSARTACGLSTLVNSAGMFNLTAPPGSIDGITVNGTGGSTYDGWTYMSTEGGGAAGFVSNLTGVNVGTSDVTLGSSGSNLPVLSIFADVQGTVWDASGPKGGSGLPTTPARWSDAHVSGPGAGAFLDVFVAGGGAYTAFLPGDEKVRILASGTSYLSTNTTVIVPDAPGNATAAPLALPHYGWVRMTVRSVSGGVIPFASIAVYRADPQNRTGLSVGGFANGGGYGNVTAPPGGSVGVNVSAAGFLARNMTVGVLPSATTPVAVSPLAAAYTIAYVRSVSVNDVAGPPTVTLRDPVNGAAVGGAFLQMTSGNGIQTSTSPSNGLGQFLLTGDPGSLSPISIDRTGFASERLPVPQAVQGAVVYDAVNLTGDGILAGRVVAAPNNRPTPGVNVTACEVVPSGGCLTVPSNGVGVFWVEVPPGDYAINLSADSFSASAGYGAIARTDAWTWIGNLTVVPDATVSGRVLGSPFNRAVAGANLTLCPANGSFSVDCAFTTPTDLAGGFAIISVPGIFYLNVSAAGYGRWSLEVQLSPGQKLDLGDLLLAPDGAIRGEVVDGVTGRPIAAASVGACPSDGANCVGPVLTNGSGIYYLSPIDPGVAELTAGATGYTSAFASATVPSGGAALAAPIALYPIGVLPQYPVTGTVIWNGTVTGIPGATITAAYTGGGFVQATVSGPSGAFTLSLTSGSFRLTATAAGAVARSLSVQVTNRSVAGLNISMDRTTYPVTGTVADARDGAPIAGVEVSAGATARNETGPAGRYHLALPNGSYLIQATPIPALLGAEFSPVTIGISIDGAGTTLDLTLPEKGASLQILAIDARTGFGIAGAAGTVQGTSRFGAHESIAVAADTSGTISVAIPPGNYTAFLNATGYGEGTARFSLNASTPPVVVRLAPVATGAGGASGISAGTLEWGAAAGIAAAAVVIYALGRWKRRPKDAEPVYAAEPLVLLPPE